MKTKICLILLLVTFECNGHLPILGGILSSARERIHSTVDNVAGAVLGGFNFNFGGHGGFKGRTPPQKEPDETIIVVVEESNENNYRPPNTNNYRPNHHDHRPHHYNHEKPHNYPEPGYDEQYQRPNHQNGYDHHQFPNQGNGNNNNYGTYNGNERPSYQQNHNNNNNNFNGNSDQVNQNNPKRPDQHQGQKNYNNDQNSYGGQESSNQFTPSTEYFTESIQSNPSSENSVTKSPSDDIPLFVPLNPNEYIYGGDKINISAPKRDTEKTKQAESEDEDFGIDVRLKDE